MEELIAYLRKTFDEPTLKIINFMERSNLLVSEMKLEQVKEGDKPVTKLSQNIIETSYLRLCDDNPEFNHNMMGEVFLHYLDYVLRDSRANWRLDINRLKQDLEAKCGYCNIAIKSCPMKVLAYIKKCIRDENLNEDIFFCKLMNEPNPYPMNEIEEENISEKILYLCKSPIDLKGAEFLLDTDGIHFEKEAYGKIEYKTIDFEVKNVSFINNLYDYFVNGGGISGSLDIAELNLNKEYSYMFNTSPVELAVYVKYLCESKKVNYYNVFYKIYTKLGKFESIPKLAYYNEYIKKVDASLENNTLLKQDLKEVLTYIRNYDNNLKLPYIKFDFLVYTKNSQLVDNIVSILNKYCRTYNYLSNKNVIYIDTELFIMRAKDSYDVILQLDKLYSDYDFLVFGNLDKAVNINEYRLEAFLSMVPKYYNRNRRSITLFCGEKKVTEKLISKYDALRKIFTHTIDANSLDVEEIKKKVYTKLERACKLDVNAKKKIDEYIENKYQKGNINEAEFIDEISESIIYSKFKEEALDDNIDFKNIPNDKNNLKLDEALEKLNNKVRFK